VQQRAAKSVKIGDIPFHQARRYQQKNRGAARRQFAAQLAFEAVRQAEILGSCAAVEGAWYRHETGGKQAPQASRSLIPLREIHRLVESYAPIRTPYQAGCVGKWQLRPCMQALQRGKDLRGAELVRVRDDHKLSHQDECQLDGRRLALG
jgi:hypothetical protein